MPATSDLKKTHADPNAHKTAEDDEFAKHIQHLMKGSHLLKIRPRRKYPRNFFLHSDHQTIAYDRPAGAGMCLPKAQKSIDISSVKEVRAGYSTDAFNRKETSQMFREKYPADSCFSLVLANGKTVDLIAPNTETCHMWINVTRRLVDQAQQSQREERCERWLKRNFKAADVSGDGFLNFEECMLLLDKLNLRVSRDQAADFFARAGNINLSVLAGSPVLDSDGFFRFWSILSERPELKELFSKYTSVSQTSWTLKDLQRFLTEVQKEHLGKTEIGPTVDETSEWMIQTFEPMEMNKEAQLLSLDGFRNLMLSSRQLIFNPDCRSVFQDMTQPLQHYFIASSHNTYFVDSNQLAGTSSIEGYISTVLTGCRCIELDCWDGSDGEPSITHGYTLSSKMHFKHALKVLRDYGFKTSDYPLIVSLENHCSVIQQRKMAEYLRDILKDQLFTFKTAEAEMKSLPSPEELRGHVLIVAKKLPKGVVDDAAFFADTDEVVDAGSDLDILENFEPQEPAFMDDLEGEVFERIDMNERESDASVRKKFNIAKALSDCVFMKEVQFKGFVYAKDDGKFHHMDNIAEPKMLGLVQNLRDEFVQHCQQHLVRIYPDGLRTDSSNFNPIPAMESGCQILAFNYQSKSKETQIYRALFSNNGSCGYLLKPKFMRRSNEDGTNDCAAMKKPKPVHLTIKVISAQQLPKLAGTTDKDITDPYVTVEVFGCEYDKKTVSTKSVKNNGFNPIWNEEFEFTVFNQDLAVLRFEVRDMDRRSRDLIGQYNIPIVCVQQGYRHMELVGPLEQKLDLSTLFVHVVKEVEEY